MTLNCFLTSRLTQLNSLNMVILKTESQLKSFMIRMDDSDRYYPGWDWDDCYSFYRCTIFLDGRKVVKSSTLHENYGLEETSWKEVIAIYAPRKLGDPNSSQL